MLMYNLTTENIHGVTKTKLHTNEVIYLAKHYTDKFEYDLSIEEAIKVLENNNIKVELAYNYLQSRAIRK